MSINGIWALLGRQVRGGSISRHVLEEIRDQFAAGARSRGVSLQTYLRDVLEDLAREHRQRSWLDQVAARRPERVADSPSATEIIRKGREDGW